MRYLLIAGCAAAFLSMSVLTVQASLHENVFDAGHLFAEPWFNATLTDAYCAFAAFYVWMAYKQRTWLARLFCLVLIVCTGTFAISAFAAWTLLRHPTDEPLWTALLRREHAARLKSP